MAWKAHLPILATNELSIRTAGNNVVARIYPWSKSMAASYPPCQYNHILKLGTAAGAALDNSAVVEQEHLIGVADGAQAVGDHKTGPAPQ